MASYSVRDAENRMVNFDGVMLGEVTTERPDRPRWQELRLYRTDSGTYVVEKVGGSKMLHADGCPVPFGDLPRFQERYPGQDPMSSDFWMCETCLKESADKAQVDFPALRIEEMRHYVAWTPDPSEAVEHLYRSKDGARMLPRPSAELLEQAAKADEGINSAYSEVFIL